MSATRGRFISVEGGEGSGKSTQAALLADALERAGRQVVRTREPGGTRGAEVLRGLLLSGDFEWSLSAEVLLHFAARADHVDRVIRPALAAGAWVVSDRFFDSTLVYQGFGQGADHRMINQLSAMLGISPDLTLVLDVRVATSVARLAARAGREDRYERLGEAFFARVRDGFRAVAAANPVRCVLIDASSAAEVVGLEIRALVGVRLGIDLA